MILTFISPLIKPFIYWSLLLLTVANKNRFSPVCSDAVFLLKRVCRVAMHTDPAQCRRAYTAHTRLQAYASHRQASAQPNCNISSPGLIDSFYARQLGETVNKSTTVNTEIRHKRWRYTSIQELKLIYVYTQMFHTASS